MLLILWWHCTLILSVVHTAGLPQGCRTISRSPKNEKCDPTCIDSHRLQRKQAARWIAPCWGQCRDTATNLIQSTSSLSPHLFPLIVLAVVCFKAPFIWWGCLGGGSGIKSCTTECKTVHTKVSSSVVSDSVCVCDIAAPLNAACRT